MLFELLRSRFSQHERTLSDAAVQQSLVNQVVDRFFYSNHTDIEGFSHLSLRGQPFTYGIFIRIDLLAEVFGNLLVIWGRIIEINWHSVVLVRCI